MSTLPPVIYFGNDWFADNRTSSHHVARQLATRTSVLYVESPGLRPPQATARDAGRMVKKLRRIFGRPVASDGLRVCTLPQIPLHGSAIARALNTLASRAYVNAVSGARGGEAPIVWCTVPHVAPCATRLRRSMLVYHCIDDYSALPGVDATAVRTFDRQLAAAADIVATASRPMFEAKSRINPATILLPHGVDVAHFGKALHPGTAPADIASLPRPIVGFIGLIERWIDLELVHWLAAQLPHVTFVMVGRVAVPAAEVPRSRNVVMLGARPYESLPDYGRAFDAAIIPYRPTAQVAAANPLKLREYLAMGLPVVSVSTPEIDQFGEVVAIAPTREPFLDAVRRALAEPRDPAAVERRLAAVRHVSWDSRVEQLLQHIHSIRHQAAGRAA